MYVVLACQILKSSKENCYVAVGSQESQRVNPNEDMGKVQKSHHPKDDSQDLTNQSSVLQVFEKKAAKGKGVTPIFVYLFSPSITDHSRSTLHPSILCLSIDLLIYLSTYLALVFVYLFNQYTPPSPSCDLVHYPAKHSP